MEPIFFPEEHWIGKALEVSSSSSVWELTEKIEEKAEIRTRKDMEELDGRSYARAEFKCCKTSNPDKKALIFISMQVPLKESMFLPPSMRRGEAIDGRGGDFDELVEAYRRLELHCCDFVPQSLGFFQGAQGDDGLVPGGFLSYIVFTSVPGDILGTETLGCDFGGRGNPPRAILNLSQEDQKRCRKSQIQDGIFWTLSSEERAVIRQKFESAFTILCHIGVDVWFGGLDNLSWDRRTQKLYFFGQFYLAEISSTWSKMELTGWGLALEPIKPQGVECEESELIL